MATHHVDDAHHRGAGGRSGGGAVGEQYMRGLSGGGDNYGQQEEQQSAAAAVAKALAAGTAALSLLLLSGLALTGTVLALILATPLLVIFSPVLVPAAFTVALLTAGFVSSGGLGAASVGVLAWMYRYLKHQPHDEQFNKAHDVKDWGHHRLDQARTAH